MADGSAVIHRHTRHHESGREINVQGHQQEPVALGDLNGDGKVDIVVANLEDNDISILLTK